MVPSWKCCAGSCTPAGRSAVGRPTSWSSCTSKRVQHLTPAFDRFFYQALKDHILTHGRINAEASAWLRRMLCADGKIDDEERKFLHELKGEAEQVSREFDLLFEESMKQPPEQRTCG
jgi:hypothetical protein